MIFDLHIHTIISSQCSSIDPVECIESAIARGLDGICVTEHDTIEGAEVVKDIAAGYKELTVLSGIEVTSREGHLLVYGCKKDFPGVLPAGEIIKIVDSEGGLVVPAHPWRTPFGWYCGVLNKPVEETDFPDLFKIIESCSGSSSPEQNQKAASYCEKTGSFGIGGSDAHLVKDIGCCVTVFEDKIHNEEQLVVALRSGRYEARINSHYYEAWEG
ncbi:MAG TPA: PHP domain-containing protein [bacterium]|nr:PHP domain-containing protein [bacterium]